MGSNGSAASNTYPRENIATAPPSVVMVSIVVAALPEGVTLEGAKLQVELLGKPAQVRVGVKMTDTWDPEHVSVNWMKERRGFTGWLARG